MVIKDKPKKEARIETGEKESKFLTPKFRWSPPMNSPGQIFLKIALEQPPANLDLARGGEKIPYFH